MINPNFEVAESDFTNNAMKCNCKYDGHRIWVHSCHIGNSLGHGTGVRVEGSDRAAGSPEDEDGLGCWCWGQLQWKALALHQS